MKPEMVYPIDETMFVYALCRCPNDIRYAIKMKKRSGVARYPFKCDICGLEGEVVLKEGEAMKIINNRSLIQDWD